MRKLAIIVCASLVLVPAASARPLLSAVCDSPRGFRVDYGYGVLGLSDLTLETGEDSFTAINPLFSIDSEEPDVLQLVWGDTVFPGVAKELRREPGLERATVIAKSPQYISAVKPYAGGTWVYSLYPGLGFGVFSRHDILLDVGHIAGSLFYAKCVFRALTE